VVGALFALVVLASALFELIGFRVVGDFLSRRGVLWPLMGLAFGLGVHFTAGRADLVAGARTLGLGLLAWILPVMVFLAAAFLATLPFTGLKPLWDTGSAASLLITACIGLIILVNAAVQDETNPEKIPRILRYAARLGGLLMAPLVVIAAVGSSCASTSMACRLTGSAPWPASWSWRSLPADISWRPCPVGPGSTPSARPT
jgi:hypothetical protein